MTTSLEQAPAPLGTPTEPGLTLADEQPRTLGFLDQTALWANLGISLLGPVGAVFILLPGMSVLAALTAVVIGSIIGTAALGLANVAGARTGRPAMVMLRGVFGTKASYLPTVLNLIQLLGWAVFELVIIAAAARQLLPWKVTWPYIVIGGVLTTVMAIRPLGSVRMLRRIALIAVGIAMVYLFVQLFRHPHTSFTHGNWSGFWTGTDQIIALSVSWIPLAADYSRHARSEKGAFAGSFFGYSLTQIICYGLGLLALSTVLTTDTSQQAMFAAFIAVPLGWLAFGVLVLRELDESFANVYSTAISVQNLLPRVDRRVLAVVIGALATGLAIVIDIASYQNFLYLVGSVFLPDVRGLHGPVLRIPRVAHLGYLRARADPLASASAMGARVHRVPACQPRLHRLVGVVVAVRRRRHRVHAAVMAVRLTVFVRGGVRGGAAVPARAGGNQ